MRKSEVLEAIGRSYFPEDLDNGVHTLEDAIPDVEICAFYPSFQWLDDQHRTRQDDLWLLTERALVRVRVTTVGLAAVDYMGQLDVRQESRSVEITGVSLDSVTGWASTRVEGPRARRSQATVERSLRINLTDGALGTVLEIPSPYDLDGADHNDKTEVNDRVEEFTRALIEVVAQGRAPQ